MSETKDRNPYDISTWGPECGRGIRYKDVGPVHAGQAGAIRKLGAGRKAKPGPSRSSLPEPRSAE